MKNLVGLLLAVVPGSGRCYPGHPTSECGNANFARLLRGYLLRVPGLVFRFALPLILDANGQASAHIHFVDEPPQRTTI